MEPARLARGIADGRIVVPKNPGRKHKACAIGEGCTVKININIGTSGSRCDPALEMKKAQAALDNGADALMDLSTGGDLVAIRKKILKLDTTVGHGARIRSSPQGGQCRGCHRRPALQGDHGSTANRAWTSSPSTAG